MVGAPQRDTSRNLCPWRCTARGHPRRGRTDPRFAEVNTARTRSARPTRSSGRTGSRAPFTRSADGGGTSSCWRARCVRQHAGQRHSTPIVPFVARVRVKRHPCCALMRVWSVSVSGDSFLHSMHVCRSLIDLQVSHDLDVAPPWRQGGGQPRGRSAICAEKPTTRCSPKVAPGRLAPLGASGAAPAPGRPPHQRNGRHARRPA
jgi:hypothetical protein